MVYRESVHVEPEVRLSAEKAILDLYHEFYGAWDVDPETLLERLKEAETRGSEKSNNYILRVLRMLMRNGHRADSLDTAIRRLMADGAFTPPHFPEHQHNPYAEECVESTWGYSKDFTPFGMRGQTRALHRFFPVLATDTWLLDAPPLLNAFRPIVVPKLSSLAKVWRIDKPFTRGYEAVISRLADELQGIFRARRSGFAKSPLDLNGFACIEPYPSVRDALMRLEEESPHSDIIVFNGQTGKRWAGSSMRRVRWHCENVEYEPAIGFREFVLPSYVIMIQLMLQPERLLSVSSLYMYCAGDNVVKKSIFGHNGVGFAFGSGVLHFMDCSPSSAEKMYGVPTGLVPK